MKKKETHVKEKEDKIKELTDLAQRIQADFENYKRRADKEQKDFIELGKVLVIKRLLMLLDSFDEAMKDDEQAEVIEPLYKQLLAILSDFKVCRMDVIGKKFDPHLHECVCEDFSTVEPKGNILEEVQRGYIINDFIIRHAKVKVSKGEERKEDDNIKEDSKA